MGSQNPKCECGSTTFQNDKCYACNKPMDLAVRFGQKLREQVVTGTVDHLDLQVEGINGIRIQWNGVRSVKIQSKGADGNWQDEKNVKSVTVALDAYQPPHITLNRFVIS